MDPDSLDLIREALEDSERVDPSRIEIDQQGDRVVLRGSVASSEEAEQAASLASLYSDQVDNQLKIDPSLREGIEEPPQREPVTPGEDEVLQGDVDMLSGSEQGSESDLSRALEENVPWDPPEEPLPGPPLSEYRGETSPGAPEESEEPPPPSSAPGDKAAADLSEEELRLPPERAPSLDPLGEAPEDRPQEAPESEDELGARPPEGAEDFPPPLPDAEPGTGATGEGTAGGGGTSGTPSPETGAKGSDTYPADTPRSGSGGTMSDTGLHRGPESRDDEALREKPPEKDPGEQ